MPGNCAIFRSWNTGESLTAADLTTSFTTVGVTNMTMQCLDDYSVDVTQMRLAIDPGEVGSESLATSSAGEIERLRFAIKDIKGTSQWYETRPAVTHSLATTSGDILVASGPATFARLGIGVDGTVLSVVDDEVLWSAKTPTPLYVNGIYGLTLSNNTLDSINDLDIATGTTVSDDSTLASRITMTLSSSFVKQLDAVWTVGSGNGMRDSGTNLTGAKTFHIFIIQRTDTNVVDIFASTLVSPTLPTGYTKKRRIGSILWSGTAIRPFVQYEDLFQLKDTVLDVDLSGNQGTTAYLATLTVPSGIKVMAGYNIYYSDNTNGVLTYFSSPDVNDQAPSTALAPLGQIGLGASAAFMGGMAQTLTNTAGQIRIRHSAAGSGNFQLRLATRQWKDCRTV